MPKKPKPSAASVALRLRAQREVNERHATPGTRMEADTQRLLHELEVHQIELEMQNAELRLARDEAESLAEKFSDLYEFAPISYFTLAQDGTILLVNLTGSTLAGTDRSRLIGRSFANLISPAFREGFGVFLQQVFLEPSKWSMEFEMLHPGQSPRPVDIEVQCSSDGKECRAAVVDITSRKREEETLRRHAEVEAHHQAEQALRQRQLNAATEALNRSLEAENLAHEQAAEALRENEWRLLYATDSAKLTYVEVDFVTGGARTAENFEAVMGYPPHPDQKANASSGSQLLLAHVAPDDRARVAAALEDFTGGNPGGRIDYRVMGDDGIERWIESRWSVEVAPDGIVTKSFATNLDITERKQAEAALRESEEFNRSIIDSSPDCIKVLDLTGKLVAFLHGAEELLGIYEAWPYLNKSWIDFWEGDDRLAAHQAVHTAAAGGQGNFVGFFRTLRDEPKWWDVRISPILNADGVPMRLLAVSRDVTTSKHAEMNLEFLASVSQDLLRSTGIDEMVQVVSMKIGTHLNLSACAFVEVNETADQVVVTHDWHRENVPGLVGEYRQAEFVEEEFTLMAQAGKTIVVNDTAADPRTNPEKFAAFQIASFICVPLIREGRWRYALYLYHSTPYVWREDEIELARDLNVRIWMRLERMRAEDALRRSEERYRTLFTSIDEGFCVVEMIFDEHAKAVDWIFLEVNPSFEKQTGMRDIVGKRVRELLPNHEEYWFEIYGKVALTGEPVRFINEARLLNDSWFDLYAFKTGGSESRKVAIIFTNITERRHTEQAIAEQARLLDLSNDAIIVRDMEGHIRFWNNGATVLYGWSRDEALGKISHILLQTKFPTPVELVTEELHQTNHWVGELEHTKRDGQRITVLARKTLVRDSDGKPTTVLENITDISERKQAELAQRHLAVLTASNLKLNEEILHRQAVERDLHVTQEAQSLLLKQSLLLQEQLRSLSHQILEVQEEERKRISRELHDGIVQTLVGISVHVAGLAQAAEGTSRSLQLKISRAHRLVEKSVETVHRFARELRPTVLDDLGLIPALHAHLKGFMENTGIRVSLKAFAGIEQSPAPVRTVLYRVAQEALVNIARHANASQVEVSIQNLKGTIRLEIADDGEGFEVANISKAKKNNRLGLLGMQERVEMVGGIFTILSAPGKSTTVRVDIPSIDTVKPLSKTSNLHSNSSP